MGFGGKGIVRGRPYDTFGLGWARSQISNNFVPFLRQRLDLGLDKEDDSLSSPSCSPPSRCRPEQPGPSSVLSNPPEPFKGTINLRAKDSKPDFPQAIRAPRGAPNILVVRLDDLGYGATSTFGGPITAYEGAARGQAVTVPFLRDHHERNGHVARRETRHRGAGQPPGEF